jgi:epsilon-lactone hydrolase
MAIEFETRAKASASMQSAFLPEGQHNFIFGAGRVPKVDQAIGEMAR